jgi:hypothetical protein
MEENTLTLHHFVQRWQNMNFANSEPCGRMAASGCGTFVSEHRPFHQQSSTGEQSKSPVYEVNFSVHGAADTGTGSGSWEYAPDPTH